MYTVPVSAGLQTLHAATAPEQQMLSSSAPWKQLAITSFHVDPSRGQTAQRVSLEKATRKRQRNPQ